jgi:hypothetical protein
LLDTVGDHFQIGRKHYHVCCSLRHACCPFDRQPNVRNFQGWRIVDAVAEEPYNRASTCELRIEGL